MLPLRRRRPPAGLTPLSSCLQPRTATTRRASPRAVRYFLPAGARVLFAPARNASLLALGLLIMHASLPAATGDTLGLLGIERARGADRLSGVFSIAAGGDHSCAVLEDRTVRCWGSNAQGQLGNGDTNDSSVPVKVVGVSGASQVVAGAAHSCALIGAGRVDCWGVSTSGQLGNGSYESSSIASEVSGVGSAIQIASTSLHTCALLRGGTVKCWGYNMEGELGDGTVSNANTPVTVQGITDATQIAAGHNHSCALLSGGTVKCWGSNMYGQLGDGSLADALAPVQVTSLTAATAIASGAGHTCALVEGGSLHCWGYNLFGQVGDGSRQQRMEPVAVQGLDAVTQVSGGGVHTCALNASGRSYCWGFGMYGQLGNDSSADALAPVEVSGLTGANQISGGSAHSCARVSDQSMRCWGSGQHGQLGQGQAAGSLTPVVVVGTRERQVDTSPGSPNSTDCGDVEMIGVRGSRGSASEASPMDGGSVQDSQVLEFWKALVERTRWASDDPLDTRLTGVSVAQPQWVKYPAAWWALGGGTSDRLDFVAAAVGGPTYLAALTGPALAGLAYRDSVQAGADALRALLHQRRQLCPATTRFVLAGHSQGAQVIGRALDDGMNTSRVAAIALMGDPTFSPTNSHGSQAGWTLAFPAAAGDFGDGVLGARDRPFGGSHPVFSGCRGDDPVCADRWQNVGSQWAHTAYNSVTPWWDGTTTQYLLPLTTILTRNIATQALGLSAQQHVSLASRQGRSGTARSYFPTPERPVVALLPQAVATVRPGQDVNLWAGGSFHLDGARLHFEWDTDGDGTFETLSEDPSLTRAYQTTPPGPIALRAIGPGGESDTAHLNLTVDDSAPGRPSPPRNPSASTGSDGVTAVTWDVPADNGGGPILRYEVSDETADVLLAVVSAPATRAFLPAVRDPSSLRLTVRARTELFAGEPTDPFVSQLPAPSVSPPNNGTTPRATPARPWTLARGMLNLAGVEVTPRSRRRCPNTVLVTVRHAKASQSARLRAQTLTASPRRLCAVSGRIRLHKRLARASRVRVTLSAPAIKGLTHSVHADR